MNRIIKRLAVPLSAAAVLGTAGFAYMANLNVGDTVAGQGETAISSPSVLHYNYGTTTGVNPVKITGVDFVLSMPVEHVQAFIKKNSDGTYVNYSACVPRTYNLATDTYGGGPAATVPSAAWQCGAGASNWLPVSDAAALNIEANN